jgi:CheY-like chemotaxis protein
MGCRRCKWPRLPDVVLLDLQMPRQDGLSRSRNSRSCCPIAILALTGYAENERAYQAVNHGRLGLLV